MGLVCGVGVYERGKYVAWENGKFTSAYSVWANMINRCYNPKNKDAEWYSQKGVEVCEDWRIFQNFAEWHYQHHREGFKLDSDLLCPDNKCYSPETCCYIPDRVNKILNHHGKRRGEWPIGVSYHKKKCKYIAAHSVYGQGRKQIGAFDCPDKAFLAYKEAKERYVREVAMDCFKRGEITEEIKNALLEWVVTPFPENNA